MASCPCPIPPSGCWRAVAKGVVLGAIAKGVDGLSEPYACPPLSTWLHTRGRVFQLIAHVSTYKTTLSPFQVGSRGIHTVDHHPFTKVNLPAPNLL